MSHKNRDFLQKGWNMFDKDEQKLIISALKEKQHLTVFLLNNICSDEDLKKYYKKHIKKLDALIEKIYKNTEY